jgi:endonuclease YncB( thermonuclease family)
MRALTNTTLLGFAVLILATQARADLLEGLVVRVSDGDTIVVLDANKQQYKIRLAGIDAPESQQPFGEASRKHLAQLVAGKVVAVNWAKRDKYGRIVGKVMVAPPGACPDSRPECPKTLDACLAQIASGFAWHFKRYQAEQSEEDRERYAFAEVEARAKRAGLWKDPAPMPPWEWRERTRSQSAPKYRKVR